MKKSIKKGDLVKVVYVPSGVQNVEIGNIARVMQPTLKTGVNEGCRIKFLDADKSIHWKEGNLELLTQKEIKELGDTKDWERIEICYRDPKNLKHHPLNEEIYGKDEDIQDLIESIQKTGEIYPLVINQRDEIISGNRRKKAAIALEISKVPVQIKYYQGEIQELEALLTYNAYRDKTDLQKSREADFWETIERYRAKQRKIANLNNDKAKTIVLDEKNIETGRASDIAAKKAGITPKKHRLGKKINAWLDHLKSTDNEEKARELEEFADSKSVNAAHEEMLRDPDYKQWKREQKITELKTKVADKSEQPFPFEIGDICLIRAAGDKDLKPYHRLWGTVISVNNFSCQVLTHSCCLHNLGEENLKRAEHLTEGEKIGAAEIIARVNAIGSFSSSEPIARATALSLVSRSQPVIKLSDLEESILCVCERQIANSKITIA